MAKALECFDLVVIGGGSAGLSAAAGGALFGAKTLLIERAEKDLGGDCLNAGCIPSKTFIRAAHVAQTVRHADRFGVKASLGGIDFKTFWERWQAVKASAGKHDTRARFEGLGCTVKFGAARFSGKDRLSLNGEELRFKRCLIATGSRAADPGIPGLKEIGCLTNHELFHSLKKIPASLIVIGGGPIGCEMAQAFQRLGSQVTLVQHGARLLPREDADAAAVLLEVFQREGITVLLQAQVQSAFSANG